MNRAQRRAMAHHKPPTNRNANQPNKVGFATLRAAIQRDVQRLRNDAGLHAWVGNNATDTLDNAGRLLWITLHAATQAGITADAPDVRILMGMGNALGDMRERGDPLDRHRAAIQSGLLAIDRLLPACKEVDLLLASAELNTLISQTRGMGTEDLQHILETT
jgi:hypothetical protein